MEDKKYIFFFGWRTFDNDYEHRVIEHITTDKNKLANWVAIFKNIFKVINNE